MIPEKLKKLIELLTQKTKDKKTIWNKGSGENQFKLSLSEGIALMIVEWPEDYSNQLSYGLTIFNEDGYAIEKYSTDQYTEMADFELMKDFYKSVSDAYYKVDETLDSLMAALSSKEVIGISEERPQENESTSSDDDDLPF
ncbi:hypothetical protein [Mucilaginibacter lappiensis]|uniref:hypothetical protein n=1 Tax=Mucilaginibacter lappiensis TaxID=354630 RepID=UPI003D1AC494